MLRVATLSLMSALFILANSFAGDENILQKTAIVGKVSVKKDSGGKALSVTIANDKKSVTIEPVVQKIKYGDAPKPKVYKITEEDMLKLADFDQQTVRVAIKLFNGKPIDVGTPSLAKAGGAETE